MWPRISEFFFSLWLAVSWMIFGYKPNTPLFVNDMICFVLIALFSLGSYAFALRRLYLFNLLMAIWLIVFSVFSFVGEVPRQNYVSLGLLLFIFALIPSPTERPSYDWERFMENRKGKNT